MNMRLACCKYFAREIGAALAAEGCSDIELILFEGGCSNSSQNVPFAADIASDILVVAGDCSGVTGRVGFETCFSLLLGDSTATRLLGEGFHLITPEMLRTWKQNPDMLGFTKEAASVFFGESTKGFLVVDCCGDSVLPSDRHELAEYTGLSVDMLPANLDYLRLWLTNALNLHENKTKLVKPRTATHDMGSSHSDFAMAFDLLSQLVSKRNLDEVVAGIVDLVTMLCAPIDVHVYLDGNRPETAGKTGSIRAFRLLQELEIPSAEYGKLGQDSFFFRLIHDDEKPILIIVEGVSFLDWVDNYLNLFVHMLPVMALAISNTKRVSRLRETRDTLRLQNEKLETTISELVQARAELQKSSDLLGNLSANLPGIVYQYRLYPDGHACFPFVSDAVYDMFGLLPEQLRDDATLFSAFRHPDDTARISSSIKESARTMQMWHEEYRVVLPGQQARWLRGDSRPQRLDDGSVLWHGYLSDVTQRKKLEDKLQQSEAHFRFVSESANALIWMSGLDKLCTWFNKVWLDFTGRTLEQEYGKGWVEGVHPDDVSRCWEIYSTNFDQRKRFEMEYRLKHHDGEYRWLLDIGNPHFDGSGSFQGFIGSCFDITDRKIAELTLQMTQFSVMYSADAVFWMDSQGCVQFANEAACKKLGYSRDELLRLSVPDLDNHHSADVYGSTWKELKDKKSLSFESVHRAKDGRLIPVEITANYHEYEGQEFNCAFVRDITDRKQAEEKLRESHEILESILGATLDGYWCVDSQGNLLDVNQAYCRLSGYTLDELLGMKIVDLEAGLDVSGIESRFENRIRYSFRYGSDQFETLHRRKNGSTWNAEVSITYRNISGGRFFVFMRDITERKRMQEDLQQIATTDELTGLINRRHFIELAHNELRRSIRLHHSLSVALIDIDHFKQVNDKHGHAAGDRVLQILAQTVQKSIREIDVFARLGGDEFVLMLPGAKGKQAYEVVERARLALAVSPVSLGDEIVVITISSGIASLASDEDSFKKILGRADRAMYQSKAAGRNRVTVDVD